MRTVYAPGDGLHRGIGGAIVSLVTPFQDDRVDVCRLREHAEWLIFNGIDGLVVCGLAGEGPVLTEEERQRILAACIEVAGGKVPVIVATGSNCTARTVLATRLARQAGADAALITVPYYSKPTQKGIVAHFAAIASACDIPIIVDNRPAHAAITLSPATVVQLGSLDNIIGIADGSADASQAAAWVQLLPHRVGVYTSSDRTALAFTLAGGSGTISDAANIAPHLTASLHHAAAAGNISAATCLERRLRPLWQALAADGTAAALKAALTLAGREIRRDVRLPSVDVEMPTEIAIRLALEAMRVDPVGPCRNSAPGQPQASTPMRF